MLGDAGSIASLVGVAVSLGGLGFAILQLLRLRGETRAAREAAEAARRAVGRDLAIADVNRLNGRLQSLMEIHHGGNRQRALDRYPEITELVRDIRHRHPALLEDDHEKPFRVISDISEIERIVEAQDEPINREQASRFNRH